MSLQPEPPQKAAAIREPTIDFSFPHRWRVEILRARPPILPARHFVYPAQAEEVERGALELMVYPENGGPDNGGPENGGSKNSGAENSRPEGAQPFLATCALGFRDPGVPTGIWSTPELEKICAVSGGYAYMIDTAAPQHFTMLAFRPVLEVRSVLSEALLLFIGHRSILAWGSKGQVWESEKLSDEGLTLGEIENGILHGVGWEMFSDRETAFLLDLCTGARLQSK